MSGFTLERGHRRPTAGQAPIFLTLYGNTKTAEQRTIIHQYGDWYTGRWWVAYYIWYSEEGPGRGLRPRPSPSSLYQM